jgi:hypothetical protein
VEAQLFSDMNEQTRLHPFRVDYVVPGLISELSADGSLTVFVLKDSAPQTLSVLEIRLCTLLVNWTGQLPILLLFDLRNTDFAALHAFIKTQLALLAQGLPCYAAFLTTEDSAESYVAVEHQEPGSLRVFSSRRQALLWLLARPSVSAGAG